MLTSCRLVYILGAPRSAQTWIGKIVDGRPDVSVLDLVAERYRRAVRRL